MQYLCVLDTDFSALLAFMTCRPFPWRLIKIYSLLVYDCTLIFSRKTTTGKLQLKSGV